MTAQRAVYYYSIDQRCRLIEERHMRTATTNQKLPSKSGRENEGKPRLGVVLLDCDHYTSSVGRFTPDDEKGLGSLPAGFFECPATWPVPTTFAVAPGATPSATIEGQDRALEGLAMAAATLAPEVDLIITDCGFFWRARIKPDMGLPGATLISSLDLLDLAAVITSRPIGVLTYSEPNAKRLLAAHPQYERLRIVGLSDQPNWSVFSRRDFARNQQWTMDGIRSELRQVVGDELRSGRLKDIGVVVLECTCFPQFRADLRNITALPILDAASLATLAVR
jgi:hypothetical protein